MIRFLCNNFVHSSKIKGYSIFFNGDSTSTSTSTKKKLLVFIRRTISISSNNSINSDCSFSVSYLMTSCGLSQEKAISVSKKFNLENPTKPDSVLTLLRNRGFDNTHISKFIEKVPKLLLADPDKTLKPKLDYLCSLGYSGSHFAKLLSRNPHILHLSLEYQIIPFVDMFKSVLGIDINLVYLLKCKPLFSREARKFVEPNISLLRSHGVPDSHISSLLASQPCTFMQKSHRFKELVEEAIKMEFDPLKSTFLRAVQGLGSMSKATREAKFDLFKSWGWSEEAIYRAFKLQPSCWLLSETNIMHKMDFFVNKKGYDPLAIASFPGVLCFSMGKRIIPRFSVIELLITNGLIQRDFNLYSMLHMTEKEFLKKFVTKYEEEVPHLMNAYQRKTEKNESEINKRKQEVELV